MKLELYNEKIKNGFLYEFEEDSTRMAYKRTLSDAYLTESIEGKDLYNFTLDEIADVLKTKQPFRLATAKNKASVLEDISSGQSLTDIEIIISTH